MLRADNIDAYSRQVGFLPADRSILHIWNRDSRYSKLVAELEHGRSFPNIPEWGDVESILMDLSNNMGSLFLNTANRKTRSARLAQMVYDAHKKINEVLNHSEELNEAEMLHWVQHIFLQNYNVIYPKNSADFISREELPIAGEVSDKVVSPKYLIIAGAGFLVICFIVVFCVARKRKVKSRQ
jgi:multiple sugar transport system substrate-binding protein